MKGTFQVIAIRMTKSNNHAVVVVKSKIGFGYSTVAIGYYPTTEEIAPKASFEFNGELKLNPMSDKEGNPLLTALNMQRMEIQLIPIN